MKSGGHHTWKILNAQFHLSWLCECPTIYTCINISHVPTHFGNKLKSQARNIYIVIVIEKKEKKLNKITTKITRIKKIE